jgi:hypothetical protein
MLASCDDCDALGEPPAEVPPSNVGPTATLVVVVRALDASSPSFPRDAIATPTRPPITNAATTAATIPHLRRGAVDGSDCGGVP